MKLTRKKALWHTWKIWAELAKTGADDKPLEAWDEFSYGCPCCHYALEKDKRIKQGGMLCANGKVTPKKAGCPLATLWPKGCEAPNSPFDSWYIAESSELRKVHAKIIASAARKLWKQCK